MKDRYDLIDRQNVYRSYLELTAVPSEKLKFTFAIDLINWILED